MTRTLSSREDGTLEFSWTEVSGAVGDAATVLPVVAAVGYRMLSAFAVFLGGAALALAQGGVPHPGLPAIGTMVVVPSVELTTGAIEAMLGQLSMTLGNAALATALLVGDYFDRDISPDQLSTSMGAMNAIAVPLGGRCVTAAAALPASSRSARGRPVRTSFSASAT
ncbi:MAG: hypothetical protein ACI8XM_000347 [Haloarculaceae archaeon]|jgi:hypothetical protein